MIQNNSEDEQLLKQYYSRYGGNWRFPDMLDYCYLVNPYFNRSAIIKEMQDFGDDVNAAKKAAIV